MNNETLDFIFDKDKCKNLTALIDCIKNTENNNDMNSIKSYLVPPQFIEEIKSYSQRTDLELFIGNSFRDIKLVITDNNGRNHSCFINYLGQNRLKISSTSLPCAVFQNTEYKHLEEIVLAFVEYVNSLESYFMELEKIDRYCCVVEPTKPTLKDDFRKILLANRIWLHIEVTAQGMATNVHLIGSGGTWHDQLERGMLHWDHDKDIVDNIMTIFDLEEFPQSISNTQPHKNPTKATIECNICLCSDLEDGSLGLPQPLCGNPQCGTYFHNGCLYEWFLTLAGGRPPKFGIASGECPNCFKYITCKK